MQPNDEDTLCEYCNKGPAVETYSRGGHTLMVCALCLDRLSVQEAYENHLVHIGNLARNSHHDEALACLEEIFESNRERDHDGWLARSITAHRALILFQAGRYAETEEAYKALAKLVVVDAWDRGECALGLAHTLEALGRGREAVAVLGDALGHEDLGYLNTAPGLLGELARLSEELGQPVDPKWRPLAEAVAEEYTVEMPANDSFGQALLTLEELTRSAKPKREREWEAEHGTNSDE